MNDRYFLDTNILVYSFDGNSPAKQEVARELIREGLTSGKAVISYQVVQEFINVSTRKFQQPLSYTDAEKYFNQVLNPLYEIPSSSDLIRKALEVAERWKYGFYDALIISGALMGNCNILYTEDLQDQQQIEFLKIVNPFR
ncbi:MAG: PIN domain-containing protein [Bacteroidota bacterium]